jgi:DNA-binding CsgD family transcriptional regulator
MKVSIIVPVICFSAFVLWLLSMAMDGPLIAGIDILNASTYFLPAHISFLLLIGLFCSRTLFNRLVPLNCVISTALTLALPLADPSVGRYLLLPLGACSAFVAISACKSLWQSQFPLLSAAGGLVIANLLFVPLTAWPEFAVWKFAAVGVPLLFIPILLRHLPEPGTQARAAGLWRYLPFIIVFQIISGLMYAFIMPAYGHYALLPGFELLFYILAVMAAFWIFRKNRDLGLVCGVVLGMAAFTLWQNGDSALPVNMGMFAMQAGAGFIDLGIIAILLAFSNPIRAFGIGLAALCTGIIGGKIIGCYFGAITGNIVMIGHLVLNISVISLYFLGRHHYSSPDRSAAQAAGIQSAATLPPGQADPGGAAEPGPQSTEDQIACQLPENLRLLLSEREYSVLKKALAGKTYRDTARELEISESTVKTYMYRVYEKMGVKGKKKLFEMLNQL